MFYICKINDAGEIKGLRSTHNADYADKLVDYYSELWPNAIIDVFDSDEYDELTGRDKK